MMREKKNKLSFPDAEDEEDDVSQMVSNMSTGILLQYILINHFDNADNSLIWNSIPSTKDMEKIYTSCHFPLGSLDHDNMNWCYNIIINTHFKLCTVQYCINIFVPFCKI